MQNKHLHFFQNSFYIDIFENVLLLIGVWGSCCFVSSVSLYVYPQLQPKSSIHFFLTTQDRDLVKG